LGKKASEHEKKRIRPEDRKCTGKKRGKPETWVITPQVVGASKFHEVREKVPFKKRGKMETDWQKTGRLRRGRRGGGSMC